MLILELAVVFSLIVLNGLLAMSELAIVSSRTSRLKAMVDEGVVGARRALALAADPGKFLSTVQIGITLVGVLSGALSGATLGLRLGIWLTAQGVPQDAAEALGFGLVVIAITYVALIIGELVPKQIALRNPEAIAVRVAPAMTTIAIITLPLVWLLSLSGKLVLYFFGHRAQPPEKVTEEEIKLLIAEAERTGVLEPGEKEMIAGVLRLGDRKVEAIMTPRREVDMIDLSDDEETIRRTLSTSSHSRLPVFDGNADEIIGVVQAKDILDAYLKGQPIDVRQLVREVTVLPDVADARDVVEKLKLSPIHMGLVLDEYGYFRGVVTTADVLESIVGAFSTEEGPVEPSSVRRADGSFLLSGWMPVDEMSELLRIAVPRDRSYHTVAGFVISHLSRLPNVGDLTEISGWRFEIVDIDGRRVDKVLATRLASIRRMAP